MLPVALVPLLLLGVPAVEACVPGCTVPGSALVGFVPPLVVVEAGDTVTWTGLDSLPHVNVEGGVVSAGENGCFEVFYQGGNGGSVTFTLQGSRLLAAEAGGAARHCSTAVAVPGGALLTYQCELHPLTMKGALVVLA